MIVRSVVAVRIVSTTLGAEVLNDLRQRGFEVLELFGGEHLFDAVADSVAHFAEALAHLFGVDVLRRSPAAPAARRPVGYRLFRVGGAIGDDLVGVPAATSSTHASEVSRVESGVGRGAAEFAAQHVAELAQQLRKIVVGVVALVVAGIGIEVRGIARIGVLVGVQ